MSDLPTSTASDRLEASRQRVHTMITEARSQLGATRRNRPRHKPPAIREPDLEPDDEPLFSPEALAMAHSVGDDYRAGLLTGMTDQQPKETK